jgi:hypothetical protein
MDVRWSVIIRVDDYSKPIYSVDRRHTILYTKPKRLGMIMTTRRGSATQVMLMLSLDYSGR